jgi:hypothetical protein
LEQESTQDKYAVDGALALAEAVETAIAQLHTSIQSTKTWDRTSEDTIDKVMLSIRSHFTSKKVPKLEQRYLFTDSTVFNDLLSVDKFVENSSRGANNSITEGMVIRTYGIEISESQLIEVSGSPVCYHNLAFTPYAIVLASRPLPKPQATAAQYSIVNDPNIGIAVRTLFWYNADIGAHQLTIELLYGLAIVDQNRILEVESF